MIMYIPATKVAKDTYRELTQIDPDLKCSDLDLSIGTDCRTLLVSLVNDADTSEVKIFYM